MSDEKQVTVKDDRTVTEVVYVAHDGEFLRQQWVETRYDGLPQAIVRPILSDVQALKLYSCSPQGREAALRDLVVTEGVEQREYYPNAYNSSGRAAYNYEITSDLCAYGMLNARRFPAVLFYVDELKEYKEDRIKQEARPFGKKWCHLTTNGDLLDLLRFGAVLGLNVQWVQHAGRPSLHFDLTPKKRALAVRVGAKETTAKAETERLLTEMRWNRKGQAAN